MHTKPLSPAKVLVLLAAASLLGAAAAHAQAPTVITSLPYTINSPGVYVLNSNLNSAQTSGYLILVSASNVTLDFQSHYMSGPVGVTSQTTYGVYAFEQSNVTVRNGTVAYCNQGVFLTGNGSATTNNVDHEVDHMRATYCYGYGIRVASAPASRINNCQVSQGGFSGASAAYGIVAGPGTTVSNCLVSAITGGNSFGILVSAGGFARQNTVSFCTYGVYGGKYQDNLTNGCTTPYSNGIDAGGNN